MQNRTVAVFFTTCPEDTAMKPNRKAILIAIAAAMGGLALQAHAARIDGKECAGMITTQRNPQSNVVTRSCRTVDGSIATEPAPADGKANTARRNATPPKDKARGATGIEK
jgi:hypothetical protein